MQLTWLKALMQLGFQQAGLYAWYQWGIKSGYLRWRTKTPASFSRIQLEKFLSLPNPELLRSILGTDGLSILFGEADEIVSGKVRLFGGEPVNLELNQPGALAHWTLCHESQIEGQCDIKLTWEPARFGWAITLARAYYLSQNERYASAFWKYTEFFLDSNPAYLGWHWFSAQEVALRMTSLVFAFHIFSTSPLSTVERTYRLAESIAQHADRIPPTLAYARAQNNNHLLTEAMGLITAARALPAHPSARKWHAQGWKWFHHGLQVQIADDGSYNQHSTNYHRLMLQAALWVVLLSQTSPKLFPERSQVRLKAATRWLLSLLDLTSGCVPNLGPNDGAYIFPLSVLTFHDYRPVLQAAGIAFLGESVLSDGVWDEMSLWMCGKTQQPALSPEIHKIGDDLTSDQVPIQHTPHVLNSPLNSWAYLRSAHFSSRPGHADQLHLDLWWRGLNIALDPGTYLYNAPAPWENALTSTFVHNTVSINNKEQMSRAGRFLYLDWAQGETLARQFAPDGNLVKLVARHNGYRRSGIFHQRTIAVEPQGWKIEDLLFFQEPLPNARRVNSRLHWLLPDWEWDLRKGKSDAELRLKSPFGWIGLKIWAAPPAQKADPILFQDIRLIRAGQILAPLEKEIEPPNPTWGWFSPTYGVKTPALSFSIQVDSDLPLTFISIWHLIPES